MTEGPTSPPCPRCDQAPLTPHLTTCPERAERRRYMVGLTPAARRWHTRPRSCCIRGRGRSGVYRCGGKATLWRVGPRGGILGQWCTRHEAIGVRAYLMGHPRSRGVLRDGDYQLRSSDEELAMWAIANGPDVRPWYGPASRASTGG